MGDLERAGARSVAKCKITLNHLNRGDRCPDVLVRSGGCLASRGAGGGGCVAVSTPDYSSLLHAPLLASTPPPDPRSLGSWKGAGTSSSLPWARRQIALISTRATRRGWFYLLSPRKLSRGLWNHRRTFVCPAVRLSVCLLPR